MSSSSPLSFPKESEQRHEEAFGRTPGRALVSVVIPTLNEGAQIGPAVADLVWADEVIVVDGGSTDDTVARAQAQGARVLILRNATIAAQRNLGIEAAENHWVLTVDA